MLYHSIQRKNHIIQCLVACLFEKEAVVLLDSLAVGSCDVRKRFSLIFHIKKALANNLSSMCWVSQSCGFRNVEREKASAGL